MSTLGWIVLATVLNGLTALVGVFMLWMSERALRRTIDALVAFAAGALFAGALVHLLREGIELLGVDTAFLALIVGFSVFFILERYLWWHHCHEGECEVHPASYLVLFGDGLHNLLDGAVIASGFLVSVPLGLFTTGMVLLHEIPQELGNFAILVRGGMSKARALAFNVAAQFTCVLGGIAAYAYGLREESISLLLPIAAGGFLYISASDLIPELHKEPDRTKSLASFALFAGGVVVTFALKRFVG